MDSEEGRTARRQSKQPTWMAEAINIDEALAGEEQADEAAAEPQKYVFKLVTKADLTRQLVGRQVFVFWEDLDMWYRAKVKKLDAETLIASIFYPDTEEEEPEVNIVELIDAGTVAFKETRPLEYQLTSDERTWEKEFVPAERRKRGRPPKGQERPRPEAADDDAAFDEDFDDEEEPVPEDSDPSYGSGEHRGKKKSRGDAAVHSGARPARATAAGRGRWEDEDDDAEAQRLLAPTAAAGASLQNDAVVREKVTNAIAEPLHQHIAALPPHVAQAMAKPPVVANAVQDDMVRIYGESATAAAVAAAAAAAAAAIAPPPPAAAPIAPPPAPPAPPAPQQ